MLLVPGNLHRLRLVSLGQQVVNVRWISPHRLGDLFNRPTFLVQ
jgi:hypothetical protein